MSFEVITDADTGDEILWFMRRGKPYLMLRDAVTKRFIKRLIGVEQRMFMVVDYSEEKARKGNPLYIDAVGVQALSLETFEHRESYLAMLTSLLSGKVAEYFGAYVEATLLDEAGEEYGSELRRELVTTMVVMVRKKPRVVEAVNEEVWYWSLVWKHCKEAPARSEEGVDVK